jgi:hypothetical protein
MREYTVSLRTRLGLVKVCLAAKTLSEAQTLAKLQYGSTVVSVVTSKW